MIKVPSTGPQDARIVIVGEAPGADEEKRLKPFVGASGQLLDSMLHDAGLLRTECFITNVCKYRPPSNSIDTFFLTKTEAKKKGISEYSGRYPLPLIVEGIAELKHEISIVRPNLIILLGAIPLWALTQKDSITSWRGSIVEASIHGRVYKCIPTYHPAAILRQWSWRYVAMHDLRRCQKEAESPDIIYPEYRFKLRPSFEETVKTLEGILEKLG